MRALSPKWSGEPEPLPAAGPPETAAADRACCCAAQPVVEVLMPVTDQRPLPVELLLCGHHYRECLAAIVSAGADVFDIAGSRTAFLSPLG